MHCFARIFILSIPFILLILHATVVVSLPALDDNALPTRNALESARVGRQIHNPDYEASNPPGDASSTNTTTSRPQDVKSRSGGSAKDWDGLLEKDHRVLFSRTVGKFQVKQLRRRSKELATSPLSPQVPGNNSSSTAQSTNGNPKPDIEPSSTEKEHRQSDSKPSSPTVFSPYPIATPDQPQVNGRYTPGTNPPIDFGSAHPIPRSFMEPSSNQTSQDQPGTQFQHSDHIRHRDEE